MADLAGLDLAGLDLAEVSGEASGEVLREVGLYSGTMAPESHDMTVQVYLHTTVMAFSH
jgi:hypothetical protein